jgi:beta-lactamase superfamily II metal-dependent hydrolase
MLSITLDASKAASLQTTTSLVASTSSQPARPAASTLTLSAVTVTYTTTTSTSPIPPLSETTSSSSTTTSVTKTTTTFRTSTAQKAQERADIYFLDVGYGDSTLIRTRNATILANCGGSQAKIISLLDKIGVHRIDYLLMTQPTDEDYGGCSKAMSELPIAHVLETGIEPDFGKTRYVEFSGIAQMTDKRLVARGFNLTTPDGLRIEVLHPKSTKITGYPAAMNSMVLRVRYGANSVLLLGDCDSACEQGIESDVQSRIIRIPNHGAQYFSTSQFLKRVKPEAAIVPYGPKAGDRPKKETMDALKAINARAYFVDNGTVHVQLNLTSYVITR